MNGFVMFLLLVALGLVCYLFSTNVWIGLKKYD